MKFPPALQRISTLRTRLVVILAAALSPILLVSGVQAYLDGKHNLTVRRDALLQIADRSIDEVEQSLMTAEALLDIFAEQIAADRCDDVLEWLSPQLPILSNVVHFDSDGVAQCSAEGETGYTLFDPHWNEQLREGVQTLRTDAFYGKGVKDWLFAIFHRLEIDGQFVGSVAFGMRAGSLVDMLNQTKLPKGVEVALSDDQLLLFGKTSGIALRPEWIEASKASTGGVLFVAKNEAGASIDIVVSRIGAGGIYAVVSRPSPGLFDNITLRPATTVGLPLLAFSIALLAVWLAIDGLVLTWLRRLQRLAQAYGSGAYHAKPGDDFAQAPEEISGLAIAMDRMSQSIGERDADRIQALAQRDAALKEIHHRVKNNLQIVTSFLNLQSRRLRDEEAKAAIAAARHRIDALSVVHQTLYQHEQLEVVQLKSFFSGLLDHLRAALGLDDLSIRLEYSIEDMPWHADDAIPLALFVVETITNATKYAFGASGGCISVDLHRTESGALLVIQDDGRGASVDEISTSSGLGRQLKAAFARQLGGRHTVETTEGAGYRVILEIPASKLKPD